MEKTFNQINPNYRRGLTFEKDFKYRQAMEQYRLAAEEGSSDAEYKLGVFFHRGLGVNRNIKSGIYWYERSAKKNNPMALYVLGVEYVNGSHVKRNPKLYP